jgi:hypothetical protein
MSRVDGEISTVSQLKRIQVALVYSEAILDVLTGAVSEPPFKFLANRFDFANQFDAALANRTGRLQPPWPDRAGRGFWAYYFEEQRPLSAIKGAEAWHGVAPLRVVTPVVVTTAEPGVAVALETFVYPHGVAAIVNLTLSGTLSPIEAATLAVKLRREPVFIVDVVEGNLVLDAVAAKVLDRLRATAFGADATVGWRSQFPFTLTTVIIGTGVDDAQLPSDGGDEHRFLDAVTTWSPTWQTASLGRVSDHALPSRTDGVPGGHVVYKHDRSRAVWFPGSFTVPSGYVSTLSCFHRNQVLAALQVESLSGLAVATAAYLAAGNRLTNPHYDAALRAGNVLGRLYGGAASSYRSRSPQAQIDDGGHIAEINKTRAVVKQKPLFAPA